MTMMMTMKMTWSLGTSLVTCLQFLWGSIWHSSSGRSLITVLTTSWQISGPWRQTVRTNERDQASQSSPPRSRSPGGRRARWAPCGSRSWWCTWWSPPSPGCTAASATSGTAWWWCSPPSRPRTSRPPPSRSWPHHPPPVIGQYQGLVGFWHNWPIRGRPSSTCLKLTITWHENPLRDGPRVEHENASPGETGGWKYLVVCGGGVRLKSIRISAGSQTRNYNAVAKKPLLCILT